MTKQEADFIGSMNMCDEISNEAYKKIMCNCEVEEQQPSETIHGSTYGGVSWGGTYKPQQPCEDCISRQALINELKLGYFNKDLQEGKNDPCVIDAMIDWAIRTVKQLPSITPKARWIPCSERLPKENEYIGDVCKYYLIQDEYGDMHVAHLSNVGWRPMDSVKTIGNEVIAWMPLPQPYKAESE